MRQVSANFASGDSRSTAGRRTREKDETMEDFKAKYVNPMTDWGFKRLFGSEMNKYLLLEFLRSLFPEREIAGISYLRNERQGLSEKERDSVFDVVCTDETGSEFVVEMQKRSQRHFRDRALYYASFPIAGQAPRGKWDYSLRPVCVVGVLNFAMRHEYGGRWRGKVVHRYRLREDETGEIMNSKLEFIYLEVGAFEKGAEELEGAVEKWMYALKNLPRLEERPAELGEEMFARLFEAARIAGYTRDERNQYENDMMNENDYWNTIDFAREEGEARGEARGVAETSRRIAKNFLEAGVPAEQVAACTGLSAEQVEELRK